MRKLKFLFLFALAALVLQGCSQDHDASIPYGPEYDVDGFELSVREDYNRVDTVQADKLQLLVRLTSENQYAQEYGINPKPSSHIAGLKVSLLNTQDFPNWKSPDLSPYFLVDDKRSYEGLYETIDSYLKKPTTERTGTPVLVFTNQSKLHPKHEILINDTTLVRIGVEITLSNNKVFNEQIKTVLLP
ncbi:MAG: hypothetical protein ACK5L5_01740 [Bacteroidales bacterium]